MKYNYEPLWILLIDKNYKKTDLIHMAGISSATLAKMSKNQPVSLPTIAKICHALSCDISDVISIDIIK